MNKALDLEAWICHLALPPPSWVTLGMWHPQPIGLSFPIYKMGLYKGYFIHVKHSKESWHMETSY